MPALIVVGSVAFDSITTPYGSRERILGGSALYFSYAASFFTDVGLVGIVGRDFSPEMLANHRARGIDTAGLFTDPERDTFFWKGRYTGDMNTAETVEVRLNVLGDFSPVLPENYRRAPFLFLANSHPFSQIAVLDQMEGDAFACSDSMNLWIENERETLESLLKRVDGFFCNDGEIRMLTGKTNLISAGNFLLSDGPGFLTLKKGEHGALLFHPDGLAGIPAYPAETVVDPTGAGDSFAGGFMGSLAKSGDTSLTSLKKALVDGTVMASLCVEGFGLEAFFGLTDSDIEARRNKLLNFLPSME